MAVWSYELPPVGRTPGLCGLFELMCPSVVFLPFCRGGVGEAKVEPLRAVAAQPGEDLPPGLVAGREAAPVDEFACQGRKERLDDAIVPAVPDPSRRSAHAVSRRGSRVLPGEELLGSTGRRNTTTGPSPPVSEYMRQAAVGPSSCVRRSPRRWASCGLLAVGIVACGDRQDGERGSRCSMSGRSPLRLRVMSLLWPSNL